MAWHVFHASLHPRSGPWQFEPPQIVSHVEVRPVRYPRENFSLTFPVSFQELAARWATLPHGALEPDGSFWWCSPPAIAASESRASQIDGMFYERERALYYVEFRGSASTEALHAWLTDMGLAPGIIVVQLMTLGLFVTWNDFLALSASDRGDIR